MARFDMSDAEWSVIQPLLPTKVRGVARRRDGHAADDAHHLECLLERRAHERARCGARER